MQFTYHFMYVLTHAGVSKGRSGKFRFVQLGWAKGKELEFLCALRYGALSSDALICARFIYAKVAFVANFVLCTRVGCEVGVEDQASKFAAIMEEIYI